MSVPFLKRLSISNGKNDDCFINIHKTEINEHKEMIDEFRLWCNNKKEIPKTIRDFQLIEFLNAADYNLIEAKQLIYSNYKYREQYANLILSERNPLSPRIQNMWTQMRIFSLPKLTLEGYKIVYVELTDRNATGFDPLTAFNLLFMVIETTLRCEGLFKGYIIIGNANSTTLRHFPLTTFPMLRKLVTFVQESIPIQLKALHVINLSRTAEKIYHLIKPFLKRDLITLIHIHTKGITSLHQSITPDLLPTELDGELATIDHFQTVFRKKVESMKEWFEIEEMERQDNKKANQEANSKK
ncbi:hypothetical protein O3M35_008871 [Rhynocoris fuscipes]|uniref:CRAL-TRIO domain-containing protein n=1 Tax=Rhynocoris fuscipes TaxID=488301 RepID=A0AAW1DDE6_9HEMI